MKQFKIPEFYRSPLLTEVKNLRKRQDKLKKDFSPTLLNFGPIRFYVARHFGFCYGVENAIEISFKALEENKGKNIYLLSQMIHNPEVNNDLTSRGVKFIHDTEGNQLIPWGNLTQHDVIIIPAFGTSLSIQNTIKKIGLDIKLYDTTCPFVEKVWNRASKLGDEHFSIVIHGKHNHEETRATFSRSEASAPSIVIKDITEAKLLGSFIDGSLNIANFNSVFLNRVSSNFNPLCDLDRIGVINQTTMLASETKEISDYLKNILKKKFGQENIKTHFADTKDTLCYATNENQDATYELLNNTADFAIVVGGYNSSNTTHLVELCEQKVPTYFISSANEIISETIIQHFNHHSHAIDLTSNFIPKKQPLTVLLTSGASCPDAIVEEVLLKLVSFFPEAYTFQKVMDTILHS